MSRYLVSRIAYSILVVWGVSVIVFAIGRMSGDPVSIMLPMDSTIEQRLQMRARMGLDRPLYIQYWLYLSRAVQGDFGNSIRFRTPCLDIIKGALPATIELTATAMGFATIVSVPLGIAAATRHGRGLDLGTMLFTTIGQATASFWLGIMLMMFFSVRLGWLPVSGRGTLMHVILPAFTLAIKPMVEITRLTRSSLLQVLPQDYVRTAYAKGLRKRHVIYKHALRNALIPVITFVGLQVGAMLGGAVITEQIFGWPGIGRLAITAIYTRDFPMVQAIALLVSVVIVAINFTVDLSYLAIDPRVRLFRPRYE